jgi:hypothetical protein
MKLMLFFAGMLVLMLSVMPNQSHASNFFEVPPTLVESAGFFQYNLNDELGIVDPSSYVIRAEISDWSAEIPDFGFETLAMLISGSSKEDSFDSVIGEGVIDGFTMAENGDTFATIFAQPIEGGRGTFSLNVEAMQTPIPTSLILLASGLMGIVGLRKKLGK